MPARILTVANQKGGVGKTTTAVSLSTELAGRFRVLLIDLDPQANATSSLGLADPDRALTTYDVLLDGTALGDVVVHTSIPNLDLAPSDRALAGAQIELVDLPDRDRRLASAIAALSASNRPNGANGSNGADGGGIADADTARAGTANGNGASGYDIVLIDTPPSLGLLTLNALGASDYVMIPVQSEYLALEGLSQLVETLELVRGSLNPRLALIGILLTMVDARTNLSDQVSAEVRRHFPAATFQASIPRSVRLSEAPSFGRPIQKYDPSSRGAKAYADVTRELLERLGLQEDAAEPGQVDAQAREKGLMGHLMHRLRRVRAGHD